MARMSAAHLAPQGGGYEPQRKYDWEIELYGVPGQDVLKLSAESFQPSSVENEEIPLAYLNEIVKVAGQAKWGEATFVIKDHVDEPAYSSIMQWKKMVHDPATGNHGLASTYKKQGNIVLIGPDNGIERRYQLIGVWPKSIEAEQLNYAEGNQIYKISIKLSVDKAYPLF